MNLKASSAVAVVALIAAAGCSSASTPKPRPEPGAVTETTQTTVKAVTFASCAEAKSAGYHDMTRGSPGYSTRLDADGDGVACVS